MKRNLLACGLTLALATAANASDLNVQVLSDTDMSSISVAPGATVNYKVVGVLNDETNEGLALVGFDLDFDGGDLAQANEPTGELSCGNPMVNFVIPEGLTNPAGYGGTIIGGNLVQCGGAQNTIKNTADNADFPIGAVFTGVAKPGLDGCGEAVLLTGSLTAPETPGTYNLIIPNNSLFANVISAGEDGSGTFWATEAAVPGTISNLEITVSDVPTGCAIVSAPLNCAIDARIPHPANDVNTKLTWDSIDLVLENGCNTAGLTAGDFNVTASSGAAPGIASVTPIADGVTVAFDTPITAGAWTCVTAGDGGQACIGSLPADANADGTAGPPDITALIDHINDPVGKPMEDYQCNMNRDSACGASDITLLIDLLNGASDFDPWLQVSVGACPSAMP